MKSQLKTDSKFLADFEVVYFMEISDAGSDQPQSPLLFLGDS